MIKKTKTSFLTKFSKQAKFFSSPEDMLEFQNKLLNTKNDSGQIEELCKEAFYNLSNIAQNSNCKYAQKKLGYLYSKGIGIQKDLKEALKWYTKAAEQGLSSAQRILGYYYCKGIGTGINQKKAFDCYIEAVTKKDASAKKNLKNLIRDEFLNRNENLLWLCESPNRLKILQETLNANPSLFQKITSHALCQASILYKFDPEHPARFKPFKNKSRRINPSDNPAAQAMRDNWARAAEQLVRALRDTAPPNFTVLGATPLQDCAYVITPRCPMTVLGSSRYGMQLLDQILTNNPKLMEDKFFVKTICQAYNNTDASDLHLLDCFESKVLLLRMLNCCNPKITDNICIEKLLSNMYKENEPGPLKTKITDMRSINEKLLIEILKEWPNKTNISLPEKISSLIPKILLKRFNNDYEKYRAILSKFNKNINKIDIPKFHSSMYSIAMLVMHYYSKDFSEVSMQPATKEEKYLISSKLYKHFYDNVKNNNKDVNKLSCFVENGECILKKGYKII